MDDFITSLDCDMNDRVDDNSLQLCAEVAITGDWEKGWRFVGNRITLPAKVRDD